MKHTLSAYCDFIREASEVLNLRCYLAGGAVRDVLLDRVELINDLDLWIYTDDLEATRKKALESGFFGTCKRSLGNNRTSLGRNGEIVAIDYYDLDGQEINIIYLRTRPASLMAILLDFDYGINQAGLCPVSGLHETEAFREARRDKVLRITREDTPERAAQREVKMVSKFPGFPIIRTPRRRVSRARSFDYD